MVPNPRVYNGWLWTGQMNASKWRFRKVSGDKWSFADVDSTLTGKDLEQALDAQDPSKAKAADTEHQTPTAAPAAPATK